LNREGGRTYGEAASTALYAARATDDPKLIVRALFESARAGKEIGDGETFARAHVELKGLLNNPRYRGLYEMHYACAFCASTLWQARAAHEHINEALVLVGNRATPAQLSFLYNGLGAVSVFLCDPLKATGEFDEALRLSKGIGDDSRISTIASNLCTALSYRGLFEDAIAMGGYAIESGLKSMNQPLLVTAYTNLIDPYVLTGRLDQARHCLNAAKEWLAHDRSWFSRICLLVEEADLNLMSGERDLLVEMVDQIDRESEGRTIVFQPGLMVKLRVHCAVILNREEDALKLACEAAEGMRNQCPLAYLDALAAKAWVETHIKGYSETTGRVLGAIEQFGMPGKRAMLVREGLLPASG
jgi:tetratricopeptide (TPR) repeat protein